MNRHIISFLIAATWLIHAGCGRDSGSTPGTLRLGAANSYLECVAQDVLGTPVNFVRLAEPGTCPGHFDLRPSQVSDLRLCRAILRFDFQKSLDERLIDSSTNAPRIIEVSVKGGMCQGASYTNACQQVADSLVSMDLLDRARADEQLRRINERLTVSTAGLKLQVAEADLTNLTVLASAHQKAFCEELGLRVAATFRASDAARMSEVDHVIETVQKEGVKWVIANLPEGRRLADALGERLGAKVVVFGNFPDPRLGADAFDALIAGNVHALLEAAK
jgi:zinc transport system substrate-binding protein